MPNLRFYLVEPPLCLLPTESREGLFRWTLQLLWVLQTQRSMNAVRNGAGGVAFPRLHRGVLVLGSVTRRELMQPRAAVNCVSTDFSGLPPLRRGACCWAA